MARPVDLIMIIDGSGSFIVPTFDSGDNPQRQKKVNVALSDALKLVESLPEGSQVMIASYTWNSIKILTQQKALVI